MPTDNSLRRPLFRLALFLVCAILIFLAFGTLYSFTTRLSQLDAIEADRDGWQRPFDVLRALNLREGSTVLDLGSGAGYFTLKLAPVVGKRGRVLSEDVRKLSLFFLWTRALTRGYFSVHVIAGEEDNPRLPRGALDAALICNAFHEFSNPELMVKHVFLSLRPGGRVVIVERGPPATGAEHAHEISLKGVETELRTAGFEIVAQNDHFIDPASGDVWWLLTARKP